MATLWFARDGKRPGTQSGPGIVLSTAEANVIFAGCPCRYCGLEAPGINPNKPSQSIKNVVLEIEPEDDRLGRFKKVGFYWMVGDSPDEVEHRLHAHRARASPPISAARDKGIQ